MVEGFKDHFAPAESIRAAAQLPLLSIRPEGGEIQTMSYLVNCVFDKKNKGRSYRRTGKSTCNTRIGVQNRELQEMLALLLGNENEDDGRIIKEF